MHKYTIKDSNRTKIIRWGAILAVAISAYSTKLAAQLEIKTVAIGAITIAGIIDLFINKYIWKIPLINNFFACPNLNGNWKVEGISKNKDKQEEYTWSGTLTIKQDYSKILITLKTDTSNSLSKSIIGNIEYISGQGYELTYTYTNKPESALVEDLKPHSGTCKLTFSESLTSATGAYYNEERETKGKMKLTKK